MPSFDEAWLYRTTRTQLGEEGGVTRLLLSERPSGVTWRAISAQGASRELLEREIRLASRLHPDWADIPLAVIRRPQETLLVYADAGRRPLLPLPDTGAPQIDKFLQIALGVVRALGRAHAAGLVLGFIQPHSLLRDDDTRFILSGFGCGTILAEPEDRISRSCLEEMPLSTRAPEQLFPHFPPGDARSNLYALGCCLYFILTGTWPLQARTQAEWRHAHLAIMPLPPSRHRPGVPEALDQILLKLLAKDPAERYQYAGTLGADLAQCQSSWEQTGDIPVFALGQLDAPWRQIVPSHVFGRAAEVNRLTEAFTRMAQSGQPEMVLISGAAGIGKSTLVRELPGGVSRAMNIAGGKSDQLHTGRLYAPIVEALGALFGYALSANDEGLEAARARLKTRLGGQGRLICDLVPGAEPVLGFSPALADMPAQLAKVRLEQAVVNAFAAFATAELPLLLFIDDLQWADDSTLSLLSRLATEAPAHMLLVGAYRAQEAARLLAADGFVAAARRGAMRLTEISLEPLSVAALPPFMANMLGCAEADVAEISKVVHQHTGGNPFFVNQLLRSLFATHAMRHDAARKGWVWEAATPDEDVGNVVDFMRHRLQTLPAPAREVLRVLACIGRRASEALLEHACAHTADELRSNAAPLLAAGLLSKVDGFYAFAHDRVQEAAYALTTPERRAAEHARLARLLIGLHRQATRDTAFAIAEQIEGADPAALDEDSRVGFATVLLTAAKHARDTGAVGQAAKYLGFARRLVAPAWWDLHYHLTYRIQVLHAEYLLAAAHVDEAAAAAAVALERARTPLDRATAWQVKANMLTVGSDYEGAIDAALQGLSGLGVVLHRGAGPSELDAAYAAVIRALGKRPIAELGSLPLMQAEDIRAAMGLLSTLISSIFLPDGLRFLHMAKMVELTLLHGVTPESAYGLSWFGVMAAYSYGDYEDGFAWALAALALVEAHGFEAQRTATLVALDQVCIWTQPLDYALARVREAIAAGHKAGDVGMACYAHNHLISDLIVGGAKLELVAEELGTALAFTRTLGYRDIEILMEAQLGLVRELRANPSAPPPPTPDDGEIVSRSTLFWVRFYGGMRAYFRGDMALASDLLEAASELSWAVPANIDAAYCTFFAALAAAHGAEARARIVPKLDVLAKLARVNPSMFGNKQLLVEAELAWLEGDGLRALRLCEQSAVAAGKAGFVHERALAQERAAAFYAALGLELAATQAGEAARADYASWGALAKSGVRVSVSGAAPPVMPMRGDAQLDLDILMPALHALSEEIQPARVVEALMTSMMVHAGADYGVLLQLREGGLKIEASAHIAEGELVVRPDDREAAPVPPAILNTVLRTRQPLVIADTRQATNGLRAAQAARSVLCVPLLKRGVLIGLMHLENRQAANVFTTSRTTMIEILAAQAAISLETARLYADLIVENTRRAQSETALRNARAELARTAHLTVMGELAASIVHEINQPFSAIMTAAAASRRWLARPEPDLGEVLAGLASIQEGVTRANNIIRALRALARQTPAAMTPVVIDNLIRDVLILVSAEIEARHVQLIENLQAGGVMVNADTVQLQQVVLNLVTNALEAMGGCTPATRILSISSSLTAHAVTIHLEDTGPGIAKEVRERMFDPLFTTKETGMGMGLAICRSILEAHGGTLSVADLSPGTMFCFTLPLPGGVPAPAGV